MRLTKPIEFSGFIGLAEVLRLLEDAAWTTAVVETSRFIDLISISCQLKGPRRLKASCEEDMWVTTPPILVNTHLEIIQVAEFGVGHASPAAGSRVASLLMSA